MFFFFFFDELYNIPEVQLAFKTICLDKMLSDGYFDMSMYIFARIKKEDMLSKLALCKSRYVLLYKNAYPTQDNAIELWRSYFDDKNIYKEKIELTNTEAEAIVNWIYRAFKNSSEREEFTKKLFQNIKDLHEIQNNINFYRGVVYNKTKVEIKFISSVSALNSVISTYKINGKPLFFRGHANPNYTLLPSVMRCKYWYKNESVMYNELLINCPEDFEKKI